MKPNLKEKFMAFMGANDHDDLPDGAWFGTLELAAEEWLKMHPEKGKNNNTMAHLYLKWNEKK